MSDWTLGAVKARNMQLLAICPNDACRNLAEFNVDELIAGVGAAYRIDDIPQMDCRRCGTRLEIKLALGGPPEAGA